jgi:2-methylaconitate isomerase
MTSSATHVHPSTIDALLMRGGTSRGLFVSGTDLPSTGVARDDFILRLLGRGDPLQVDGLGGGNPSTSKLVAVTPSTEPDIDLDYLYAGVVPGTTRVTYEGNCGNLTAAVGMYGLLRGWLTAAGDHAEFILRNLNTSGRIRVQQPLEAGAAARRGSYAMDGIEGLGAEVVTTYLEPSGATLGALLPTSHECDIVSVHGVGAIPVSIVDVTSGYVFVEASSIGLTGHEHPDELNGQPDVLAVLEAVRGSSAAVLGLVDEPGQAASRSPGTPRLAIVASPDPEVVATGHVVARAFAGGRVHHALSVTGAMCIAAAAALEGTVVHRVARRRDPQADIVVTHPKGAISVKVELASSTPLRVVSTTVSRTARLLMSGVVHL